MSDARGVKTEWERENPLAVARGRARRALVVVVVLVVVVGVVVVFVVRTENPGKSIILVLLCGKLRYDVTQVVGTRSTRGP